jgi:DNA-binding NtrC family response regulator
MLLDVLLTTLSKEGVPLTVEPRMRDVLVAHDWPGNVRELRNVLERAAYIARATGSTVLDLGSVPLLGLAVRDEGASDATSPPFTAGKSYRDTKAEWEELFEKRYVTWLLERNEGNISAAAREADMDRKYLHKLAKKHGLHPADRK